MKKDLHSCNDVNIATIEEFGVELGSGIKESLLSNVVLYEDLFYHSMLFKWTTSLADSTWVICQWKPSSI